MQPEIVEKGRMILVGFSFFGDPFDLSAEWTEENEIGRLWNRLMGFLRVNGQTPIQYQEEGVAYEVHLENEETLQKGHYDVFVGVEVEELEDIPLQMVVKILPPTKYAVFTLVGEQIISDWPQEIFGEWLSVSAYHVAYPYIIQRYDYRFKGLDNLAESVMDVLLPVLSIRDSILE